MSPSGRTSAATPCMRSSASWVPRGLSQVLGCRGLLSPFGERDIYIYIYMYIYLCTQYAHRKLLTLIVKFLSSLKISLGDIENRDG